MKSQKIAIIDYGMGNLRSVANAFRALGADPACTSSPEVLRAADAIVLPGVGAFGEGMQRLHGLGLVDVLEKEVRVGGKPFIGLCLGMQLLATTGEEHGRHSGLGWIPGTVRRLRPPPESAAVRVPHVGWNDLEIAKHDGLLKNSIHEPTFYFVHSYVLEPDDTGVVSGYSTHGVRFAASVESGNIFGTQFHPEKSQRDGMTLLQRFLELVKRSC